MSGLRASRASTTADDGLDYHTIANTAIMFDFLNESKASIEFLISLSISNTMQKHIVRQEQVLRQSIKQPEQHPFAHQDPTNSSPMAPDDSMI